MKHKATFLFLLQNYKHAFIIDILKKAQQIFIFCFKKYYEYYYGI